jgi:HSP20 family protein
MFGSNRWSPVADLLNFQKEFDRLFTEFWTELPTRANSGSQSFQVTSTDDAWRIDIPMAGIDPQYVTLEVAGNTLNIRVEPHGDLNPPQAGRYEQTLTLPQFLDLDKIGASHRHGMLQLTVPLKESVKPRRVQIDAAPEQARQLNVGK